MKSCPLKLTIFQCTNCFHLHLTVRSVTGHPTCQDNIGLDVELFFEDGTMTVHSKRVLPVSPRRVICCVLRFIVTSWLRNCWTSSSGQRRDLRADRRGLSALGSDLDFTTAPGLAICLISRFSNFSSRSTISSRRLHRNFS